MRLGKYVSPIARRKTLTGLIGMPAIVPMWNIQKVKAQWLPRSCAGMVSTVAVMAIRALEPRSAMRQNLQQNTDHNRAFPASVLSDPTKPKL
ncbi:hypothetical protein BQ8482_320010 [Mesorhizobium delmotii]|uniref:Uncharacterized protein n=1 Tax=Mesorhizobium delmotii TaxID=1631247 RepID=A0A2P9ANY3_9HYPH|nr:hypothetical protein BQ8482_320010 [Mesorhizobium delmotii]